MKIFKFKSKISNYKQEIIEENEEEATKTFLRDHYTIKGYSLEKNDFTIKEEEEK